MPKVTMLVTQGWGSSPKYWVRARRGHGPVTTSALNDVCWGEQVLEADISPLTAYLKVPLASALATDRIPDDLPAPSEHLRGQLLTWSSPLGVLGMNPRRPYRSLEDALALLKAAWSDCGWDVRIVDHRSAGGGYA